LVAEATKPKDFSRVTSGSRATKEQVGMEKEGQWW